MRTVNNKPFFFLFAISGFSGLIYESIWTHYLKLFLGHAAYAQTLVLAIFMGGMAIGSWLCSKYSPRWKNLLLGYALSEGIIGLFALLFHNGFVHTIELSYSTLIPRLGMPAAVLAFKWIISSLMILPQSILLGMTFPLMSAGILRLFPEKPGRSIAMLYFSNSMGAAIGVLASGFILIRLTGLPGTIRIAGLINIALALTVWLLAKDSPVEAGACEVENKTAPARPDAGWYRVFLGASLVTGAASFIYEIGWIRMLSLVLGSSTHAFELMLSAFILGLAFGGLWIQRRIDRIARPVRFLAQVQVLMGILALSTLVLYGNTFEVMKWIVRTVDKTDTGYALFNLTSSAIAMTVMLPTTFCAGMTLPLITFVLIKQGQGERSIGAVYAANTVGAIIGVFFAIHLGMPLLGLKGLITFGAGLDIALGFALLWSAAADYGSFRMPAAITATGLGALAATLLFVHLDAYKMASGVYRTGFLSSPAGSKILYHKDGKTATTSCVINSLGVMSIRTNGKIDAGIMMAPRSEAQSDESTMILLAAIPMAFNPQAATAASIGLGSGLTSHTLLCNPSLQAVDTVEIEKGMVEAARNFGPRVELVYNDPRSRIYLDDAKTFFSTYNKKYDLIVSEPSNPWVSGVAGLFSEEFYKLIRRHVNEDGLFVQWVQLYEIDVDLVVSVLKAISENFSDFAVYAANDSDMIIVAKKNGRLPAIDMDSIRSPGITAALHRVHVEGDQDISLRKVGTRKSLDRFLRSFSIPANSDYYPVLDQNAARTRFLGSSAQALLSFTHTPLPTLEMMTGEISPWRDTTIARSPFYKQARAAYIAMGLRDYFLKGVFEPRYGDIPEETREKAAALRRILLDGCVSAPDGSDRLASLFDISLAMIPYLRPGELEAVWRYLAPEQCADRFTAREKLWHDLFRAVSRRDARTMSGVARSLLANEADLPVGAVRYLVASGMLGSLAQNDRDGSYRLWSQYKKTVLGGDESSLLFRLLAAESAVDR